MSRRVNGDPDTLRRSRGAQGAGLAVADLKSLLGPRFAVATAEPALRDHLLLADELAYVERAGAKRRAEFGTARVCAREALAQLGTAPASLVPFADRSPRWPTGIVGSISHTRGCCVVGVTSARNIAGFGIDVERDEGLQPSIERAICTEVEQQWLASLASSASGWIGKLFFSAKEAVYKCQYPSTRTPLAFQDITLSIDLAQGTFAVSACSPMVRAPEILSRVNGRFLRRAGFILTAALLEHCPIRPNRIMP